MKPVKTDSPEEPKSSVYAQNRCVARQLGWTLPSTFSFQPSQLPALTALPSGLGGTAALQEPSSSGCFLLTEKTGLLSRWQASDTTKSTEHVNSFYSHSSLGNQKAKDSPVISLVLWTSTPPRPATHFWFLCSQCPGICSVGNRNREPIAPQLLPIKMCNWISHVCFKHHSRRDLQATV